MLKSGPASSWLIYFLPISTSKQWTLQVHVSRGRGDYFWFGLIFLKKGNQTDFFKKKTKPVQTDRFWVRFFRTKTGSNRFGLVFSVWLGFFLFGFGSVQFFQFQVCKTESIGFFKILIGFFSQFGFFSYFFLIFSV
jgi:hypothetical protein